MNEPNELREARGQLRQFMRGLQEDPAKNVIPYGNDATLSDSVWITHAEVVQQFVRLNPKWKALAATLTTDSSRTYRLGRQRWSDAKQAKAEAVAAVGTSGADSLQLVLETEPMANAFRKALAFWCGKDAQVELERRANGDYLVEVWPKSAAEADRLGWLCEGFKQGYSRGKQESPAST